jgi:hypothetical protein
MSCSVGWAQQRNFFDTASPKLKKLLANNLIAYQALTNELTKAFSTNSVRLFYFYSEDESQPRAFHFYPWMAASADVYICVRENQTDIDEYICFLYEVQNSKGRARFEQIFQAARNGDISRNTFAIEISRVEFEAVKATKQIIATLKLSKKQQAESYYYNRFANCPAEYEEFEAYTKRISPHRDSIGDYEKQYDRVRRALEASSIKQTNSAVHPKQN